MAPTIDVSDRAHRDALLQACRHRMTDATDDLFACILARMLETYGKRTEDAPLAASLRVLSSPTESAAIVRALLSALGFFALPVDDDVEILHPAVRVDVDEFSLDYVVWEEPGSGWSVCHMLCHGRVPALILALLDAKNREAAIAALREAGR